MQCYIFIFFLIGCLNRLEYDVLVHSWTIIITDMLVFADWKAVSCNSDIKTVMTSIDHVICDQRYLSCSSIDSTLSQNRMLWWMRNAPSLSILYNNRAHERGYSDTWHCQNSSYKRNSMNWLNIFLHEHQWIFTKSMNQWHLFNIQFLGECRSRKV